MDNARDNHVTLQKLSYVTDYAAISQFLLLAGHSLSFFKICPVMEKSQPDKASE